MKDAFVSIQRPFHSALERLRWALKSSDAFVRFYKAIFTRSVYFLFHTFRSRCFVVENVHSFRWLFKVTSSRHFPFQRVQAFHDVVEQHGQSLFEVWKHELCRRKRQNSYHKQCSRLCKDCRWADSSAVWRAFLRIARSNAESPRVGAENSRFRRRTRDDRGRMWKWPREALCKWLKIVWLKCNIQVPGAMMTTLV